MGSPLSDDLLPKQWLEPTIVINGIPLTFPESLVIRVAVSSFLMQLSDPDYRKALGPIAEGYEYHLTAVARKMYAHDPPKVNDA